MTLLHFTFIKLQNLFRISRSYDLKLASDIFSLITKDLDYQTFKQIFPYYGQIKIYSIEYSKLHVFFEEYKNRFERHKERDMKILANIYNIIDNICISQRLLLNGFSDASGNLMRHALEGFAAIILLSSNKRLKKTKNGSPSLDYYSAVEQGSKISYPSRSVELLEYNLSILGLKKDSFDVFNQAYKYFHRFSHPSALSISLRLSTKGWHMCGSHNERTINRLDAEIKSRIEFIPILVNILDYIKERE